MGKLLVIHVTIRLTSEVWSRTNTLAYWSEVLIAKNIPDVATSEDIVGIIGMDKKLHSQLTSKNLRLNVFFEYCNNAESTIICSTELIIYNRTARTRTSMRVN
jgi:hypothetical protein